MQGLYNYGSHLIDLLMNWYGPIHSVQAIGNECDLELNNGQDRNISFVVI